MENPYHPEQQPVEKPGSVQPAEVNGLESKIAQAEPAADSAASVFPTTDAAELQKQLPAQNYDASIESDRKISSSGDGLQQPIEVKGFEKSGLMSNGDVQKYLGDTLPPDHIQPDRITEIKYPNEYKPVEGGTVLGMCSTDTKTNVSNIEIYNQNPTGSDDPNQLKQTIIHEVGHNVYWNQTPEQQAGWNKISQSSQPNEYVSNYARTNTQEDFSETYASYVRDPELLKDTSMVKYNFMRDHVFSGRQYGN
jgi:hypothetical protein